MKTLQNTCRCAVQLWIRMWTVWYCIWRFKTYTHTHWFSGFIWGAQSSKVEWDQRQIWVKWRKHTHTHINVKIQENKQHMKKYASYTCLDCQRARTKKQKAIGIPRVWSEFEWMSFISSGKRASISTSYNHNHHHQWHDTRLTLFTRKSNLRASSIFIKFLVWSFTTRINFKVISLRLEFIFRISMCVSVYLCVCRHCVGNRKSVRVYNMKWHDDGPDVIMIVRKSVECVCMRACVWCACNMCLNGK